MPDIVLTPAARDALLAHARVGERRRREVCGVLGGERVGRNGTTHKPGDSGDAVGDDSSGSAGTPRVTTVRRVSNVAATPHAEYELDAETTLAAIEAIEDGGETVVGFYHSHPAGPPVPSATDRARATWPGYVYLIVVSGSDPEMVAWRWTGERFERLSLEVVDCETN